MLTPDDERTLQVLEDVRGDGFSRPFVKLSLEESASVFADAKRRKYVKRIGAKRSGIGWKYVLTDAGRAKLAELREKKGRGE